MNKTQKAISVFTLLVLLTLTFAVPVFAFEGREGDNVVIAADEVIDDDLYVGADNFTLNGTVKGDLIVGGSVITINGTVEGDLWAAGQLVIINGVVMDDARIAGAGLQLGDDAQVGGDLLAAGASLETKAGSSVGSDLLVGAGQALLAGDVERDVLAGTSALELRGDFGRDVKAYVDQTEESVRGPSPNVFMQQSIPLTLPSVAPGLTVADSANIAGDLEYTSTYDLTFPGGAVGGEVNRVQPEINAGRVYVPPTPLEKTGKWALDSLRTILTLVILGLLLGWLTPVFMHTTSEKITAQTWPSLGWGAIAWAAFFFALLLIVIVMIAGGVIFGFLTLGGISGVIIWLGILSMFALIVLFVLATAYVSKIVVGEAVGKWILGKFNSSLAEHRFWPMILGVILIAVVVALLRFPLLPLGFFGWLLNFAVVLFGLGALWLWGRDRFTKQPAG
ncbi:MAG: polymer-forming cytoskeletal protein [Anaerolineales bacterium]|jgi:cytoskeletal protein CcmA (bactofilin family)